MKKAFALTAALAVLLLGSGCQRAITFGVVTDIQYDPGEPVGTRYYNASVAKLKEALAQFNRDKVQFVVNLGDAIDRDIRSFDDIRQLFALSRSPVYSVIGNHDLNLEPGKESRIPPALGLKEGYYAISKGGWRFIFLNGFELHYPFPVEEPLKRESEELYAKLRVLGKENAESWNGGLGSKQLAWLERELNEADSTAENALIFCHFPAEPESDLSLWNGPEVTAILEEHPCVKGYLSGHNHAGGYVLRNGIHYLSFAGMVETPDRNAFAVVRLKKSRIEVTGFGREKGRRLGISPHSVNAYQKR